MWEWNLILWQWNWLIFKCLDISFFQSYVHLKEDCEYLFLIVKKSNLPLCHLKLFNFSFCYTSGLFIPFLLANRFIFALAIHRAPAGNGWLPHIQILEKTIGSNLPFNFCLRSKITQFGAPLGVNGKTETSS